MTPLELVDAVADDDEHTELAWLVTRVLWADLARDLRIEDVEAAEEMAASVRRRLSTEQTGLNRLLGWVARTSLRDPYTDDVPNRRRGQHVPARRGRRIAAAAAATALATGACAVARADVGGASRPVAGAGAVAPVRLTYPSRLVPSHVGPYAISPEPALEANYARAKSDSMVKSGRVFTVRDGDEIQGSIQVALFTSTADLRERGVQREVEDGLNAGVTVTRRYGLVRLRVLSLPEQQMFLWFPADHNVMELFVMRKSFSDAERLVESIITYQRGLPTPEPTS